MTVPAEKTSHTVDSFHRGRFWLMQPAGNGHRAGIDAMLLSAAVPDSFCGRLADLGAGAGAAGLAVAARCPQARATLVERSAEMAGYARQSAALERNGALRGRVAVLEADVTFAGRQRQAAGLADRSFDFVIMNPPFNEAVDRATPDPLKRLAHVMDDGLFEKWVRTAAAIARPRARLALIARPASLPQILAACEGRFGDAEIVPVHPRPAAAAIRIVLRACKGARGGLSLRPPLVLHEEGHGFAEAADAVINGRATLFGD